MKAKNLKQIIREEIKNALTERGYGDDHPEYEPPSEETRAAAAKAKAEEEKRDARKRKIYGDDYDASAEAAERGDLKTQLEAAKAAIEQALENM